MAMACISHDVWSVVRSQVFLRATCGILGFIFCRLIGWLNFEMLLSYWADIWQKSGWGWLAPISLWTYAIWYGFKQSGKTRRGHLLVHIWLYDWSLLLHTEKEYILLAHKRWEGRWRCHFLHFRCRKRQLKATIFGFFYVAGTWSRPRVIGRFCFSSWQTRKMIPSPFYFSPSFIYRFNPASKPLPRFHKRHFGHSTREYKKLVQGTSMIGLTLSFSLFLPLSLSLCACVWKKGRGRKEY